jgi:hypothetical protein
MEVKGEDITKKMYRLKENQAFSLSLELGRREKVAWHPSADFLSPPPPPTCPHICLWRTVTLLHFVGGVGKDFVVDTIIAVKLL